MTVMHVFHFEWHTILAKHYQSTRRTDAMCAACYKHGSVSETPSALIRGHELKPVLPLQHASGLATAVE